MRVNESENLYKILNMSFPCTKCGLCCQHIDKVIQLSAYHSGDGICIHYDPNIGCKIYSNRPDVCRIDDGYTKFFQKRISRQAYYKKNAEMCNQLQTEHNLDKKFRVNRNQLQQLSTQR